MKVSMEWLRELVDIQVDGLELAEILTRGGIEVGSVEALDRGFEYVVIGEIVEITKHPNAEKLLVCCVNLGNDQVAIVTGAANLRQGDRVPVALPGAELPNGVKIGISTLRGVESRGMLCSTEELLLDEAIAAQRSKGGIMILPPDAPIGESVARYLGLDDMVLDLELYPNRPDCLAMVNVAREVASLTGAALRLPQWAKAERLQPGSANRAIPGVPEAHDVKIAVQDFRLCARYAGLLVEDVRVAPSPQWMQRRLRAAGVRPINNIVDITNYCMLEMGQPLHAFDQDKIHGTVHVRRANPGEKLQTLDGILRTLDEDMLLIADDAGPLGLAGVMGGQESEVTAGTRRLLIESAHFAGASIRRTSRRLGLVSEASARFEKGVNAYGIVATLGRVAELLQQLGAGRPAGLVDVSGHLPALPRVELRTSRTSGLLGVEVSEAEIRQVLDRLNFSYVVHDGQFTVSVPSYRLDIQIEEELIEEIARLTGYDRIPATLPAGQQTQGRRSPEQEFRHRLRHLLVGLGLDEVLTYSFARPEPDAEWGNREQSISLLNPLREELKVMRTSMVPGLLEVAQRNVSRRNTDLAIFELGHVYLAEELPLKALPREVLRLAGVTVGKSKRHWRAAGCPYDFFYVKGVFEAIGREFGLIFDYRLPENLNLLHPGRAAAVYLDTIEVGFLGEIHPLQAKMWNLERAVVFELDLAPLMAKTRGAAKAAPNPRFPAVQRDLAVVVKRDVPASAVAVSIQKLGGGLLQQVDLFDVYTGKPIPEEHKSLAFALRYQSWERTLTDEEVNLLNGRILEGIQQEFGAEWRR